MKTLAQGKSEAETVQSLALFLGDGFGYSLNNLPITRNPVETFLFRTKYGNCEYFASALAVMLRISRIPSRIVVGYRGGSYNNVGNYYLVRQKDAHVWVEAYVGRRWMRIDPTPASTDIFGSIGSRSMFTRFGLLLDSLNYYWYVLVISYSLEKQVSVIYRIRDFFLQRHDFNLPRVKKEIIGSMAASALVLFMAFIFWKIRLRQRTSEQRILFAFLKRMERLGYKKAPYEGLEEFVSAIKDQEIMECAYRFVQEFEAYFYADITFNEAKIRSLRKRIREIGDIKPSHA